MLLCFSEDPLLSSFLIKIECALVLLSPPRNASRIQVQPAGNHENVKWKNPKGVLSWSQTNPRMEGGSQQLHAHRITRITPSLMELQVQQSSLGPQGAETLEQGQRTQARWSPEAALTCASLEREGGAGAQWDRPRIQWLFNWYEKTPSGQRHTWHAPSPGTHLQNTCPYKTAKAYQLGSARRGQNRDLEKRGQNRDHTGSQPGMEGFNRQGSGCILGLTIG